MPQARKLNKIVLASLFAFILQGCDSSTSDSIAKPVIDKKMTKEEQRQALIDSIKNPAEASTMLIINKTVNNTDRTQNSKYITAYKACLINELKNIGWTAKEHLNFKEVHLWSPETQAVIRRIGEDAYQKRYAPISKAGDYCKVKIR